MTSIFFFYTMSTFVDMLTNIFVHLFLTLQIYSHFFYYMHSLEVFFKLDEVKFIKKSLKKKRSLSLSLMENLFLLHIKSKYFFQISIYWGVKSLEI